MENRIEILEGLRAAKTAFQETLDYCKKDGVSCQMIYNFTHKNNTELGICYFLEFSDFEATEYFVKDVFGHNYLTPPLKDFKNEDKKYIEQCIKVTETRVKWLESKIKELEAIS